MSLQITPLCPADAHELSALLLAQRPEYMRHFHPFPFDEASLSQRIASAQKDRYWGFRLQDTLAGFFMLRGFDDGYERPSFGVFVAEEFSGQGLGKTMLRKSLEWCREQEIKTVMLKVHSEHRHARTIYKGEGFQEIGICKDTGYTMMEWNREEPQK